MNRLLASVGVMFTSFLCAMDKGVTAPSGQSMGENTGIYLQTPTMQDDDRTDRQKNNSCCCHVGKCCSVFLMGIIVGLEPNGSKKKNG